MKLPRQISVFIHFLPTEGARLEGKREVREKYLFQVFEAPRKM